MFKKYWGFISNPQIEFYYYYVLTFLHLLYDETIYISIILLLYFFNFIILVLFEILYNLNLLQKIYSVRVKYFTSNKCRSIETK